MIERIASADGIVEAPHRVLPDSQRVQVHPTVILETLLSNIGDGARIWAYSHISNNVIIGPNSVIGEGVYIGPNVVIGRNCKIQNHCLIYEGVTLEDEVFFGPNVITTNDIFPRAVGPWDDRFRKTLFKRGASVCANSTVVCGHVIGEYAMIGAGSVVTQNIKPHYLAYGNPARHIRRLASEETAVHP